MSMKIGFSEEVIDLFSLQEKLLIFALNLLYVEVTTSVSM
jgi:hypothetical protein